MREAVTFRGLLYDGNRVVGAQLEDKNGDASECSATIVVGADGIWSTVARAASAATEGPHLRCPSANRIPSSLAAGLHRFHDVRELISVQVARQRWRGL
jgi:2-polyprenyl-6-methoxyphenol hydroxylase-like FAD-dependent oxidoreductase